MFLASIPCGVAAARWSISSRKSTLRQLCIAYIPSTNFTLPKPCLISPLEAFSIYFQLRSPIANTSAKCRNMRKPTLIPNDARPTALQIIEDEGLIGKLEGKAFFVTGVSSGIGIETLKALHATGAHAFGTVCDVRRVKPSSAQSWPRRSKPAV